MAGFTTSQVSVYTRQIGDIFYPAIAPDSLKNAGIKVVENVKYKYPLNLMNMEVYPQLNGCGSSPSGSTIPMVEHIEACALMIKDRFCMETLRQYMYAELESAGTNFTGLDWFQNDYITNAGKLVDYNVNKIFWNGNTDTGTGVEGLCDGISGWLSGHTYTKTGTTTLTPTTIVATIETMINALPDVLKFAPNLWLYVSPTAGQYIPQGYNKTYGVNGYPVIFENGITTLPGYPNIKVSVQYGMKDTQMLLTYENNLVYVTDVLNEGLRFTASESVVDDYIYTKSVWKQGAGIVETSKVIANF